MYLNNLGFFKEKAELKERHRLKDLNSLTAKLKNNTLRRMLCAYLQQELQAFTCYNAARLAKQKRLLARLKLTTSKHRTKKRILRKNTEPETTSVRQQKTKCSPKYLMR